MIAGEASGDLHAAHLAKSLRHFSPDIILFGAGGNLMREAGVRLEVDLVEKAVVGLVEVLKHLSEFKKIFAGLTQKLQEEKPDAVILVDYPGFNLRFAKVAKRLGIRVIYYISPQVWAWGSWRIPTIRKNIDQMIVVFPFEEIFYKRHEIQAEFVGHPLLDFVKPYPNVEDLRRELSISKEKSIIGLLPGSREKEVSALLPVMIEAGDLLQKQLPNLHFLIFKSPTLPENIYSRCPTGNLPFTFVRDPDYGYRSLIDFSLVASGTATLENAILGKPMVILYKTSFVTALLVRFLIRIPYIGLVNVVAGKKIVPECLQGEANPKRVSETALTLLQNPGKLERMRRDLLVLREKLGEPGASSRAAQAILQELQKSMESS